MLHQVSRHGSPGSRYPFDNGRMTEFGRGVGKLSRQTVGRHGYTLRAHGDAADGMNEAKKFPTSRPVLYLLMSAISSMESASSAGLIDSSTNSVSVLLGLFFRQHGEILTVCVQQPGHLSHQGVCFCA